MISCLVISLVQSETTASLNQNFILLVQLQYHQTTASCQQITSSAGSEGSLNYWIKRTSFFYIYCEHYHVYSSPSVNLQFNLILSLKVATSIPTVAITTTLVLAKDLLSLLLSGRNREAESAHLISNSLITWPLYHDIPRALRYRYRDTSFRVVPVTSTSASR